MAGLGCAGWMTSGRFFSLGFLGLLGSPRCDWAATPGNGPSDPAPETSETIETRDTGASSGTAAPDGGVVCTTRCPLRVDTQRPIGGDGSTWETPLNDLQLAIRIQSEGGGGEVWVRGGPVDAARFTTGQLELASNVAVSGGFEGFEQHASERRAEAEPTTMPEATSFPDVGLPILITGQHSLSLDNFDLVGSPLFIEDSSDVTVTNVLFGRSYPLISAVNSSVRFEQAVGTDTALGSGHDAILFDNSRVAFVDSSVNYYEFGNAIVVESDVSLERFDGSVEWVLDDTSRLLAVDSTLSRSFGGDGIVTGGDVVLVGSRVSGGSAGQAAVHVRRVLVYNSTFAHNHAGPRRGAWPRSSAIYGSESVEVSFSTFFLNSCDTRDFYCYADIFAADELNNSLFVPRKPADSTVAPEFFAVEGALDASNCATYDFESFNSDWLAGTAFARTHPCPDIGDAHEGAASLVRLKRFTPPFLEPPFSVDLSRYDSPEWWRHSSASSQPCRDEGPPDPGHHIEVTCQP